MSEKCYKEKAFPVSEAGPTVGDFSLPRRCSCCVARQPGVVEISFFWISHMRVLVLTVRFSCCGALGLPQSFPVLQMSHLPEEG